MRRLTGRFSAGPLPEKAEGDPDNYQASNKQSFNVFTYLGFLLFFGERARVS